MSKQKQVALNCPLFCSAIWCVGSIQSLARGNLSGWETVFFLTALALGIALCVMSFKFRPKFRRWMQAILAIQGIYYLLLTVMLILLPGDPGSKILACIAGVGMLVLIAYAAFSVPNSTKKE